MATNFKPNCLPTLIGSLPLDNHEEALKLVLKYTPEIPIWVQLPVFKHEGMVAQFLPGLPGLVPGSKKACIDTDRNDFDAELLSFYEEYMAVDEGARPLVDSRFALSPDTAEGFFVLNNHLANAPNLPAAVKGQVTGPFTFCTSVCDQNDRAIFYNLQLRDAAVKLLALKARWQVQQLAQFKRPVIIFLDEPALAGFGSSEYISVTPEEIKSGFEEIAAAIHAEGGLVGIHVCANTDWSLVLESSVDIVNFDAYAFFDRFILYPRQIKRFIDAGGILAWGIVPTLNTDDIEKESTESLLSAWLEKALQIEALGIDRKTLWAQSLITPSCGAGSLPVDLACKVLAMTRELSDHLQGRMACPNRLSTTG